MANQYFRRHFKRVYGSIIETLESRTLLSESATAQLALVSTTGTVSNPVYNYDITLTNTGTTNIGTFWFAWVPGDDFLPSEPSAESSPTGWGNGTTSTPTLEGSHNSSDGTSIQWIAKANALLAAGQSLSGFDFSTTDSPAVLAGNSMQHPASAAMTSFIYEGQPFSDSGFQFTVAPAVVVTTAASTTTLVTSAPSINAGDSLTLTATVAPTSGTGATPTGTVSFLDGSTILGTQAVGSDGTASLTTTSLPAGTHSLTAQYGGDSNYSASTSVAISETVVAPASETASAQLTLVSTIGTLLNPIYNYNITLTNTGTENLGTFWFAWIPGENFLPTSPVSVSSPVGWGNAAGTSSTPVITHSTTSPDGYAIQWVAQSPQNALAAGQSLSGFAFSSSDSPAVLNGMAPEFPIQHVLTSFVYTGAPFSDAGDQFDVTGVAAPTSGLQPTITETNLPSTIVTGSKTRFTVPVTLSNLNADKTVGKATTKLFASVSGALDGTQIQIGTLTKKLSINGNSSATVNIKVSKLPPTAAAGTYHLIASTTDAQNTTFSTITSDTINVAAPTINFSAQATPLALGSLAAGAKTSAKAVLSITNTGNIISKGTSNIELFATTDQNAITGTPIVTKKGAISIKPGANKSVSIPLKKIPSTLVPASYFVLAQITDPQGHITFVQVSTDLVITGL